MVFSEYLNDVFAPFGKKAGLSGRDLSLIWTPQIIASLVDVPVNLYTTDLGSRVMNAILGIGTGLAVATGYVKGIAAAELEEMASYWITSLYVPTPESPVIAQEIINLANGITGGNIDAVKNALFKSECAAPNELIAYTGVFNQQSYTSGTNTPLTSPIPCNNNTVTASIKPAVKPAVRNVTVNKTLGGYEPNVSVAPSNTLKAYSA